MNRRRIVPLLLAAACALPLLGGCAGAVVGGAATGAAVAHDRRTPGTFVDDQMVELKAMNAIFSDKELYQKTHIAATSYNGVVLLTGEAPSSALRERAGGHVRAFPEVRRVHNEITVAAPSSAMTRASDTWITTKSKTKMFVEEGLDATRIKVKTVNGTVFLMGLVSRAEADKAVNVTRTVAGVQRVVKLFEYLD